MTTTRSIPNAKPLRSSLLLLLFLVQSTTIATSYCTGYLCNKDIAGIWRLKSKKSFLPRVQAPKMALYPLKEFTVYPKKKSSNDIRKGSLDREEDILLLLREDGKFVQYESPAQPSTSKENTYDVSEMKGSWALIDGRLILATARSKDIQNIRTEGHNHDTILEGKIVATSDSRLIDNPVLLEQQQQNQNKDRKDEGDKTEEKKEDIHLSVPQGDVKIGKFFYPQNHPSFFEQPIFDPTSTGSFELRQVLGNLNTQIEEDKLVEKFRKKDLMNKKYFITSYPLPKVQKKRKRWSIKYNKYMDAKPKTSDQEDWEEKQRKEPIKIKTFEVELFANNTFQTGAGLGDTILRGKWSIVGEKRDQLWLQVWRFGFGRNVSGSTFSEGKGLSQKDDVAYWGKIYEVDTVSKEDSIEDNPLKWKGTKIEINGSVMLGLDLEPCSIARFTMIEKTEDDYYDHEDEEDDDEDNNDDNNDSDLSVLSKDIGSFE